jgi:hypothetical protein
MVGVPQKTLTFSRAMACNTVSGSKRGWMTWVMPARMPDDICTISPKTWKSGRTSSDTSLGWYCIRSRSRKVFIITLEWVSSAPFGSPVVPDV